MSVEVAPGGFTVCEVVHCPVLEKSFAFFILKLDWELCSTSLNSQIKMALSTH